MSRSDHDMTRRCGWCRRAALALAVAAALGLAGCETAVNGNEPTANLASGPKRLAHEGLKAIQEGRLKDASTAINAALKLDVRNSSLQFLNGFAYHLRALREDRSLFPMAEQGYQLAIQFDETNWMARYHLGLLQLDQRNFAQARTTLADAMLYNDSDPELLYSLAVAAYYARDPVTAAGALARLREIAPNDRHALRASSLVLAALDKPEEAKAMLARYSALAPTEPAKYVARRVREWGDFHGRIHAASLRPPIAAPARPAPQLAQGAPPDPFASTPPDPFAQSAPPPMPAPDPFAQSAPPPVPGAAPDPFAAQPPTGTPGMTPLPDPSQPQPYGAPMPGMAGAPGMPGMSGPQDDPSQRMVIVDVVIVSSEEDITTAKGVNLLNGLQFMFGAAADGSVSSPGAAFSRVTTGNNPSTTTITRALTIPSITYSLNIANAGTTRNEILARPSLVATSGVKSEFFSGSNIRAAAVAAVAGGTPTGSIDVDKDIGVKLGVTPQFVDSNRVRLQVEAERTFLQDSTASVTFDLQLRTSKTTVNANVVLSLGETLILSGLSEKETANVRSGVPGLQDIPGVQYLFSRQTTRDFNKSVLILLTPRTTEYVFQPREARERAQAGMSREERILSELQARYSDWFRPYPNWASVFHHLQENSLYREFRTGDVALERWETYTSLDNRLKKLGEFLYF